MAVRWFAFVVWAAVAASAVGWALRLFVQARPAPVYTVTVDTGVSGRADLTRLLGVDVIPSAPVEVAQTDSRFRLVGVAASRASAVGTDGLALISIDGKPAKAYRVGSVVDGDIVLQEVLVRGAVLGPRAGAGTVRLDIPPLPPPATGSLTGVGTTAGPAPVTPPALSAPPAVPISPPPAQPVQPMQPGQQPALPEATAPQLPQG